MWKKAFIRTTLIGLVVLAVLVVYAARHTPIKAVTEECTSTQNAGCPKNAQGAEFIIWESLSRTMMANIQY